MGLQEILTEIHRQADTEIADLLNEARLHSDKMIVDKAEELESLYREKRESLETELKRLSAKLTAKAELDVEREKQMAEIQLIEETLQQSYQELCAQLRKDEQKYIQFLIRLAKGSVRLLEGKSCGLSFNKEDEKYFDTIKNAVGGSVNLLPAVKIVGGLICISGDAYIDNSIETLYSRLKPEFVRQLASLA